MTAAYIAEFILPAALALLPPKMDTLAARAELLAIGLQESKFEARWQQGGPAHGFWQFEPGPTAAVAGVLAHPATRPIVLSALTALAYPAEWFRDHAVDHAPAQLVSLCFEAILHNDVLACVFARLLLWTDRRVLPTRTQGAKGWAIYLAQWQPGQPHPETWGAHFAIGWALVAPRGPALRAVRRRALADMRV